VVPDGTGQDPTWPEFTLPANLVKPNTANAVTAVGIMNGSLSGLLDAIANLSNENSEKLKVQLAVLHGPCLASRAM
jgi:hypothetical protein